jgi:hypothetical protein
VGAGLSGLTFFVGLAAVVAIAGWGYAYLRACLAVLASPGVVVRAPYEASGGLHEIEARSVTVDLAGRRVLARDVRLDSPRGRLASAAHVELDWSGPAVRARVKGLEAVVERDAQGRLSADRALPMGKPGDKPPLLEVEVDQGQVTWRDSYRGPRIEARFEVSDARFSQGPEDVLFRARVGNRGGAPASAQWQSSSDGSFWLRVESPRTELAGLGAVAARFAEGDAARTVLGLAAGSLVAAGRFEVSREGGSGPAGMEYDLVVDFVGAEVDGLLRSASGQVSAVGDESVAKVAGRVAEPGRELDFRGHVGLGPEFRAEGAVRARLASLDRAWEPLRAAFPRNIAASGVSFEGTAGLRASGDAWAAGRLRAASVRAEGETVTGLQGTAGWDGRRFLLSPAQATWQGSAARGSLEVVPATGKLAGAVRLGRVDLKRVLSRFGTDSITGHADAHAIVSGTIERPEVTLVADGAGAAQLEDARLPVRRFTARVDASGPTLRLTRLDADVSGGRLLASGRLPTDGRGMEIQAFVSGLDASTFGEGLEGRLAGTASLTGSWDAWRASGIIEASDAAGPGWSVPLASARFEANPDEVRLEDAQAVVLDGLLAGEGSLTLGSRAVSGSFSLESASLSRLTGGQALGQVSASGQFGGTLDDPRLEALLQSDRLRLGQSWANDVRARVVYREGTLRADDATATFGGGQLVASAEYSLAEESGIVTFDLKDALLHDSLSEADGLVLGGTASIQGAARFGPQGLVSGSATGRVRGMTLDDTLVGSGQLRASLAGTKLSGTVEVGSLERYASLRDIELDLATLAASAQVDAYNVELSDFVALTRRWSQDLPDRLQALFRQSEGYATISGRVWGMIDDLQIEDGLLAVDRLRIRGVPFGSMRSRFQRSDRVYRDVSLEWRAGDAVLAATGEYSADGPIRGFIDVSNVEMALIEALLGEPLGLEGTVGSVTAAIGGTADEPLVTGTALVEIAGYTGGDGEEVELPVRLLLDEIGLDRRRARFRGTAYVQGLSGAAELIMPWSAFDPEDLERARIEGSLVFEERQLADLAELLPSLDVERSEGTVGATVYVAGFGDSLALTGSARLQAERVAFRGFGLVLEEADFLATADRSRLTASGSARGADGGSVALELEGGLRRPLWIGASIEDTFRSAAISGTARAEGLVVSHRFDLAQGTSRGTLDAGLRLAGTPGAPTLAGFVRAYAEEFWLPEEFAAQGGGLAQGELTFDNLDVLLASGSRVRNSSLDAYLGGSGTLAGSLADPSLNLPLVLDRGTLKLPTSRIKLEPGGVVDVTVAQDIGGPSVRATLNIEGSTQVTARRFSGQYEMFDVTVRIRGDALSQTGLDFTAQSDPPELSQEEILSLLGRADLIRALATGAAAGRVDSEALRETLYGFALPSLTESFFASVADQLRLDFVRVDYNPFDLFTLVIGKTFGKGLLVQASRQLQQQDQQRLKYDLRLVYRVPFGDRFVRRLRLGLGTTELVPWRLTLDWTRRF